VASNEEKTMNELLILSVILAVFTIVAGVLWIVELYLDEDDEDDVTSQVARMYQRQIDMHRVD
jgi:hypothetical protein